jgi:hypothetical protein
VPISSWWCVLQFLGGLLATIFLDIVHISIFYPRSSLSDTGRFSAGMAILSLLLKPFSCCLVYHMHRERGGVLPFHTGEPRPLPLSPALLSLPQPLGLGTLHQAGCTRFLVTAAGAVLPRLSQSGMALLCCQAMCTVG